MSTTLAIMAQLAGDYKTLVLGDAPVGYWRLGDSEGYAQAVLSDAPVGYWRMDAASGTSETDRSGGGHAGTYSGGFTLNQAGALSDGDTSAALNGAAAVDLGNIAGFAFTGAFSVEAFVKWTGSSLAFCVTKNLAAGNGWTLFVNAGQVGAWAYTAVGGSLFNVSSVAAFNDGAFHHIVASWDGTTNAGGVAIYVDAVRVVTAAAAAGTPGQPAVSCYIGRQGDTTSASFTGTMDEVAIYSYALSAQQIANHYALRTSTIATVAAATVADSSGNGNTGAVAGGVTFGRATNQPDLNTAALFNGTTGSVNVPDASTLHLGASFSLEVWFKAAANAEGDARLIAKRDAGALGPAYELLIYSSTGQIQAYVCDGVTAVSSPVSTRSGLLDGQWHHAVFSRAGATGVLYIDGVVDSTSASYPTGSVAPTSVLTLGSAGGTIRFLNGTLDEVAVYNVALTAAQVQNHYLAGFWTELTADLTVAPITIRRGFQSNAPDDLIAAPATLQFSLDNSIHNSGSTRSYYSPDSTSRRPGWQNGILLRCQVTANGTTRTRFWGWLETTAPKAGIYEEQTVACMALGWIAHAATTLAAGLTLQTNKRGDQLVAALQALVPFQPPAVSLATGVDTYPFALDDLDPTTSTVVDGLDSAMKSGFDRLWEKADGTLVFETRWFREMIAANALTLTDTPPGGQPGLALVAVPAERRRDAVKNRFQVSVHPRRIDAAAVVLYALQISATTPSIAPGASVVFSGTFVDPNQQAQAIGGFNTLISDGAGGSVIGTSGSLPVADFGFGSVAGGTDLSASVTVTVAFTITDVTFTVTNTAAVPAVPSKLQCRGQGIYNYQSVTATETDAASQRISGQNTVTLDCPYQADPYFAQSAALYGLNLFATALTQLDQGVQIFVHAGDDVTMDALLQREISDAIGITETMTGLAAGNYWINAIEERYDERTDATFTLALTPRDPNTYFTLDVSTLDGPDVLAAI